MSGKKGRSGRKDIPDHMKWKKGQSGNPSGRPKHYITAERVRTVIDTLSAMSREAMHDKIQDPAATMLEIQIASIIARAAKDGDYGRMNFLLDRMIGKVSDEVNQRVTGASGEALPQIVVTLPSNSKEVKSDD